MVVLDERTVEARRLREGAGVEAFEESTAIVEKNARLEADDIGNGEPGCLHGPSPPSADACYTCPRASCPRKFNQLGHRPPGVIAPVRESDAERRSKPRRIEQGIGWPRCRQRI